MLTLEAAALLHDTVEKVIVSYDDLPAPGVHEVVIRISMR